MHALRHPRVTRLLPPHGILLHISHSSSHSNSKKKDFFFLPLIVHNHSVTGGRAFVWNRKYKATKKKKKKGGESPIPATHRPPPPDRNRRGFVFAFRMLFFFSLFFCFCFPLHPPLLSVRASVPRSGPPTFFTFSVFSSSRC